jgi:hypothetical protein
MFFWLPYVPCSLVFEFSTFWFSCWIETFITYFRNTLDFQGNVALVRKSGWEDTAADNDIPHVYTDGVWICNFVSCAKTRQICFSYCLWEPPNYSRSSKSHSSTVWLYTGHQEPGYNMSNLITVPHMLCNDDYTTTYWIKISCNQPWYTIVGLDPCRADYYMYTYSDTYKVFLV